MVLPSKNDDCAATPATSQQTTKTMTTIACENLRLDNNMTTPALSKASSPCAARLDSAAAFPNTPMITILNKLSTVCKPKTSHCEDKNHTGGIHCDLTSVNSAPL
jgi:hypothetical protein